MLKLIIFAALCFTAALGCSDTSPKCASYADDPKFYCSFGWTKRNCFKLCGLCSGEESGSCGQQKIPMTRVVGGKDAKSGSWPWQIGMYYNGRFHCGGSLVNSKWIVTAAHCMHGTKTGTFKVVLGDYDHTKDEGEQTFKIKQYIVHPDYRQVNNDIALIELEKPAMFNDRVQPICLPAQGEAPQVGSQCFLTGWGKIRHPGRPYPILQQLPMVVQSHSVCHVKNKHYFDITEHMICGANPKATSNQSGCHGDSGGPFVCQQSNGSWKLHGAVSWGSPRCEASDAYSVFARVAMFRHWIDQYITV